MSSMLELILGGSFIWRRMGRSVGRVSPLLSPSKDPDPGEGQAVATCE